MERLAARLREEIDRKGIRDLAERTNLGVGTLSRLMNQKAAPDLETLVKLSNGLSEPLADVVEWAGYDLGLPADSDALLARLRAEAAHDPQLAEILDLLREVSDLDRRAVLTYLRGALQNRQPDEPDA